MAKKALLDVLNQTIGKYVKNLDAESLNVAVWSGKIELHSLALDVDAVNAELDRQAADQPNLGIPFRVIGGTFDSLEVDVPWAHLMSKPVVLRAGGLTATVEPYNRRSKADFMKAVVRSEEERAKKIRHAREDSIKIENERRLSSNAVAKLAQLEDPGSQQNSSTFAGRLARRILENIQIEIRDVHVSLKGTESTAGVVLESLSLVTTDKDGNRTFVDRTSGPQEMANSFLYKTLDISGLGVYIDENLSNPSGLVCVEETSIEDENHDDHRYILSPLSFEAKLRQSDGNVCIEYPKYELTSELSTLSILLSKTQLEHFREISLALKSEKGAIPLFPEYRPLHRITKETAAAWWKYAARCVGRMNGRSSWVEFFRAFRARKAYIPLYKRASHYESCHWLKELSAEEKAQMITIEQDRTISVEGIMAWRNIADAQFEREQQKYNENEKRASQKNTTSVFYSLFGSRDSRESEPSQLETDGPPITLTVEEMKELEDLSLVKANEATLSDDSKYCDVKFVLGSFKVYLTSRDKRQLVALETGKVATEFNANADGSFTFDWVLFSLEIQDKVTPRSLFPSVLSRVQSLDPNLLVDDYVFRFNAAKTKSGDAKLFVKLIEFQAIASPLLLIELKRFFAVSEAAPADTSKNPTLEKSLSGSVDLFYDAEEGTPASSKKIESLNSKKVQDISNKLVDAWKKKTEMKTSLIVDLDIDAPKLVIPENCVDMRANLLIFDLGHMRFCYGKIEAPKVQSWFEENPRYSGEDFSWDNGRLDINNLTFMVKTWKQWLRQTNKPCISLEEEKEAVLRAAVVEPISLCLELGVESQPEHSSRICSIGIIPTVALRISPAQVSNICTVAAAWLRLLKDLRPPSAQPTEPVNYLSSKQTMGDTASSDLIDNVDSVAESNEKSQELTITNMAAVYNTADAIFTAYHFSMSLQRLSITVCTDVGGIDANLVAARLSASQMSDGSSLGRLSVGWFWILDRFISDGPRQQRLVVHSSLPKSPKEFAIDGKYDIVGELEQAGVFKEDSLCSSDLADITFQQVGPDSSEKFIVPGEMASAEFFDENEKIDRVLRAKFSSFYIHWNPRAIKTISLYLAEFLDIVSPPQRGTTLSSEKPSKQILITPSAIHNDNAADEKPLGDPSGILLVHFEMRSLEMSLDSARDDLPVFVLTMSNTSISMLLSENEGKSDQIVCGALGDLRVNTSDMGKTNNEYRTILGLAPGLSKSLLSVKYCSGPRAIKRTSSETLDLIGHDAYACVELSPMRMVYIQAQVLALVEYITEGILGALAAKAASSAAAAAVEIASSTTGSKMFVVKANALDLVLPQSAQNLNHFCVHAGELEVKYISHPMPGGGMANLSLCRVLLQDTMGVKMQDDPIRMHIDVILPPLDVGTQEDQTMRVDVIVSRASFKLSKTQYNQLMATIDENFGELDLFLRDSSSKIKQALKTNQSRSDQSDQTNSENALSGLTHAGVVAIDTLRRMYAEVKIDTLSLEFSSVNLDPIVRLSAVEACIAYHKFPDQSKTCTKVSLANLVCDDLRRKATGRQYRTLIGQPTSIASEEETQDLFYVSREANDSGNSSIDLRIGSPRFVLIPDVVSEILDFVSYEGSNSDAITKETVSTIDESKSTNILSGTQFPHTPLTKDCDSDIATLSLKLTTSRCSMVLVDLGSHTETVSAQDEGQDTETIVLEGTCSITLVLASDKTSGETKNMEFQLSADQTEIYTAFGREVKSPLQILEPAGFSVVISSAMIENNSKRIDIRAAALSSLDLSLSMRNVALISAILSGLSESIKEDQSTKSEEDILPLSSNEVLRIEELASALESANGDNSEHSVIASPLSHTSSNVSAESSDSTSFMLTVNMTMPDTKLTFINDLQGLDEALFRMSVQKFVGGGQMKSGLVPEDSSIPITFDFHINTLLLADYFDASVYLWKVLLTEPWEVTVKGTRANNHRFRSPRLSTRVDIESFPCYVSFSEQFLVSLASANRMWSIYNMAISSAVDEVERRRLEGAKEQHFAEKAAAASAARNMITTLPYALDNHTGIDMRFTCPLCWSDFRECGNGSVQYFRFEPPRGSGFGGKRLYGQDISRKKSLKIIVDDFVIEIDHVDAELGQPQRAHPLHNGRVLITCVAEEGKTIVVHLSSSVGVHNRTSVPFAVSVAQECQLHDVGVCKENKMKGLLRSTEREVLVVSKGKFVKSSQHFSIPIHRLDDFQSDWRRKGQTELSLVVSPQFPEFLGGRAEVYGTIEIELSREAFLFCGKKVVRRYDVVCRPKNLDEEKHADPFVLQATVETMLIDDWDFLASIFLEPRAEVLNRMPVSLSIRTLMPNTFSAVFEESDGIIHHLGPDCCMEVFTPGPSIAVTMKCCDTPVAGASTGWMDGGWIDLPLVPEFRLLEPLECIFPFQQTSTSSCGKANQVGSQFTIVEGRSMLSELPFLDFGNRPSQTMQNVGEESSGIEMSKPLEDESSRSFSITICNFAVDHTGHILFQQSSNSGSSLAATPPTPYSTFASLRHHRRITLLPLSGETPIRLLKMSMDHDDGVRQSMPFCVKDISISEGGIQSMPILWGVNSPSGYFAYRKLINDHQSEIHIVPEFVVFNGSNRYKLVVRQHGASNITIEAGKFAPVWVLSSKVGLVLSMEYTDIGCRTPPMQVDSLGLRIAMLKAIADGNPIGSLAIQTVIGAQDSRLVVKVGEVNFGSSHDISKEVSDSSTILQDDFLRFRIQVSELRLTLNETLHLGQSKFQDVEASRRNRESQVTSVKHKEVCMIILNRLTVDWQKIFKEDDGSSKNLRRSVLLSPERSQLSVILHSFQILDKTPNSPYPIVFDASCEQASFIDLCARFRGPLDADLVKVDLFDLNLAHAKGRSETIVLNTSEDFVWKLLDLLDRISSASAELGGVTMVVKWDANQEGYVVQAGDNCEWSQDDETKYTPPKSDKLYDINLARVSPFTLLVSFKRTPQASRYTKLSGVRGANIVNYFTHQLKFKIDKAALKFSRYEAKNLKGPPDRLLESLKAVYLSRIKRKVITIMTAASFQDWKYLASRDHGDDEFVEGDLLRATGNLAGNTTGYVLKKVGKGLGKGVKNVTSTFGDGIENATDKIGVGAVGAGINSVVSGVGEGVGDTLSGVGVGASKILKGAGQGIGQLAGGVSGGVVLVGKGIGKGVVKGSAKEVVSGVAKGAASIGSGVGKGVESTVMGATEGVLTVGKGLFSGVKNVGKGLGGAFTGRKSEKSKK